MIFIDFKKTYDKISSYVVDLNKHKVSTKYVGLINYMYNNVVTSVRTSDMDKNEFPFRIGLQGSTLSPYIFVLVMDKVI
jgi:hypothetical protein